MLNRHFAFTQCLTKNILFEFKPLHTNPCTIEGSIIDQGSQTLTGKQLAFNVEITAIEEASSGSMAATLCWKSYHVLCGVYHHDYAFALRSHPPKPTTYVVCFAFSFTSSINKITFIIFSSTLGPPAPGHLLRFYQCHRESQPFWPAKTIRVILSALEQEGRTGEI
jgi:hypothetical protein